MTGVEDETMSTRMPAHASKAHRLEAWTVQGDLLGSWEHAEAASVLALVASLPAGEPMRCFNAAYAIWAHGADGEVLFDLEFCFGCFWVGVREAGERQRLVAFDAESDQARELLARFRAFAAG
ncbi:hypothetical protein V1227_37590 [Lentzea sp. DG1S-22]|uniref:hypothetical protein n=1 Tax=Lentzea sp. DG1S-22 TaxID=3108822 RepID=UPI002E782012|nr:hypothetical protein [Lentzea sp. DG1S-22]WVH80641.1 hypothetical protein V1227_37590 [Lentzea sp. DG1S-22]